MITNTLPLASSVTNRVVIVIDPNNETIIVKSVGGDLINGSPERTMMSISNKVWFTTKQPPETTGAKPFCFGWSMVPVIMMATIVLIMAIGWMCWKIRESGKDQNNL